MAQQLALFGDAPKRRRTTKRRKKKGKSKRCGVSAAARTLGARGGRATARKKRAKKRGKKRCR